MSRLFRTIISVVLVSTLVSAFVFTDSIVYASGKTEVASIETINDQLEANIQAIEKDLKERGTTVQGGLEAFIFQLEEEKQNNYDAESAAKLNKLISIAKDLLGDYVEYKNNIAPMVYHPIYTPAIAAVLVWFYDNNYLLSAELLANAQDNTNSDAVYYPYYASRVTTSPVVARIMLGSETSGSDAFPNSGNQYTIDLYYAIHAFDWTKNPVQLVVTDYYDFAPGDYDGIAGIAVNTMYLAQEAGVLTPFHVTIIVY